jgi:putative NADPH-quinone reductase
MLYKIYLRFDEYLKFFIDRILDMFGKFDNILSFTSSGMDENKCMMMIGTYISSVETFESREIYELSGTELIHHTRFKMQL